MIKLLVVCTGNICRSPTAEGILRTYAQRAGLENHLSFDSAGTHGYHIGEPPDRRAMKAALKRGVDISGLRARQVAPKDYAEFDLILAADKQHLRHLHAGLPGNAKAEIDLFLPFAGLTKETEIPDPYYSDDQQFEYVLDLLESAAIPLINKLKKAG